MEFLTTTGH